MLKLSDIMTRDVVTVTPETTLRDAVELFTARHISGSPVVSGSEIRGVLSATDILAFAAGMPDVHNVSTELPGWTESNVSASEEEPEGEIGAPGSYFTDLWAGDDEDVMERMTSDERSQWSLLDEHTVDEVMTRSALSLAPSDSVLHAAEIMRGKSIHRVLVMDEGRLVGIVSALDVARAVAEHKLVTHTYVFNRDRDFEEPRSAVDT